MYKKCYGWSADGVRSLWQPVVLNFTIAVSNTNCRLVNIIFFFFLLKSVSLVYKHKPLINVLMKLVLASQRTYRSRLTDHCFFLFFTLVKARFTIKLAKNKNYTRS